ncbi:ABC transporter ATP-binding protein [Tropicimonas sp. IMCC6043]|uniref:ABC transporter ATP-binding protein n=1 Tax=Tropicimonas sp. IMCC6043 TaxID=2510645 RepID=UPI00101CD45D|nr:ABC transporter ATP-binding protein [Tropicimonas sp. IMCC6043]RYH09173.1 ABC transporter ATP-binding protein [Tropicimonas sp. IMCC6043]
MPKENAIETRSSRKVYGAGSEAVVALDDVSIAIRKGEFFTLLGPSGCGKTTLLRLIAGFETPTSGHILLNGQDITDVPPNRRPVNTVFQSYALFPHLSVRENVGFGLQMKGRPASEIGTKVERALSMVQLGAMADRKPAQLSGGQQQRVALARALAPSPEVLLLDEPLSALDLKLRKEMQSELKRLQHELGITFIFVTHDQEEALTMSDRIGVMSSGRLLQIGSPREIYNHPVNRFVADFIGETNFIPADVHDGTATIAGDIAMQVAPDSPQGRHTIAVRPEHVRILNDPAAAPMRATVTDTTYFGTDSHVRMLLQGGTEIVARYQSEAAGGDAPTTGTDVGVSFAPGSVQVLQD